jgi:hypothetical protein
MTNFFKLSFWRMPESSQNNYLLDVGIHQHDSKTNSIQNILINKLVAWAGFTPYLPVLRPAGYR